MLSLKIALSGFTIAGFSLTFAVILMDIGVDSKIIDALACLTLLSVVAIPVSILMSIWM